MSYSEFTYRVLQLTECFYSAYPNPPYREILKKKHRAYNCLFVSVNNYILCIPYRSNILHPYAYHFTSSKRAKLSKSGLDYTKIVIIQNQDYISKCDAIIDNDEYRETVVNIDRIVREACQFVNDYVLHVKGEFLLHPKEFNRRYEYSSLVYFHDVLGI